ncbi:hypothetical protein DERF_005709 [Dermatophagoides farinae]|uniref:Uncharacterized protein n=1 Tax=Dermatophagoides farinae TaxID=6954 RepID=A0A922I4T2_DERFA|nr:hypothetical protein DERF_005709 [Dermatophagoides farinae]
MFRSVFVFVFASTFTCQTFGLFDLVQLPPPQPLHFGLFNFQISKIHSVWSVIDFVKQIR